MKRRFSGALLALLLLLSLTACGEVHSATLSAVYGNSSGSVDLPVAEPEANAPESNAPEEDLPDTSQDADSSAPGNDSSQGKSDEGNQTVDEDGWYTSKEEVALYIHLYGELPSNYVTKSEAEDAGWSGGNVERYTGEGTAIGGSRFGNREGLLPKAQGRTYTECDIDTPGSNSRGAKRIVFSNDGLIYYTDDHYESFELLYGEP